MRCGDEMESLDFGDAVFLGMYGKMYSWYVLIMRRRCKIRYICEEIVLWSIVQFIEYTFYRRWQSVSIYESLRIPARSPR
jgi:hypothetical protein